MLRNVCYERSSKTHNYYYLIKFSVKLTFYLSVQYIYYNLTLTTIVNTPKINMCLTSSYLFACCSIWSISKFTSGLGDMVGCNA